MTEHEIVEKLKQAMVEDLALEDIRPEDIETDIPLFGEGLGLDSIDAAELVVLVEKYFKVSIVDAEEAQQAFGSVGTLARFIMEKRSE